EGSVTPIEYHYVQRGSEQREKKLVFSENGAQYWKLKHCRLKGCTEREHEVKKVRWKGIFPWGTKRVHCDARHCRVPEHHIWVLRQEHRFERPYFDLLTAIYTARQISLVPGSAGTTVAVINDGDRWLVKVTARREKRLQVRAGTFDAVELILDPVSEEGTDVNEKFSGLFGLNGSISVWVDRKTNRPILVKGTLPFAFMDLQATVELTEVSSEVQVSGSGKAKEKRGE
ncbi:MAG: DUF3108 domain-containing protein, partial [Planctomycetota bacterium]